MTLARLTLLLAVLVPFAPSAALGSPCYVEADDLTAIPAPAVIVLGERFGTEPDLSRAARVVRALARQQPVTLGLQVIPADRQAELERFQSGELSLDQLPDRLAWTESPWPWKPYARLVSVGARPEVQLMALGVEPSPPPAGGGDLPMPPDYVDWLYPSPEGASAEGSLPEELKLRIARQMAWTDYRVAERAVFGWDGKGYLVLVVDRARVDSGRGVAWQAQRLTSETVHGTSLAWGGAECGDNSVWKMGWLRLDLPSLGLR